MNIRFTIPAENEQSKPQDFMGVIINDFDGRGDWIDVEVKMRWQEKSKDGKGKWHNEKIFNVNRKWVWQT